ncbi:MAG TPA: metal ABC transporter substrate-binding protein [Dehalococcoidales bacterium]|nr:metal ABC transporter substrate-binding protein [Dehalococcoidales bacterium]
MRKYYHLVIAVLVLGLVFASLLGGCSPEDTSKLKVVTSTSLIASIVERVGGDKVDVVNIIPPAQCPGHFDVKPSDIQKLADADLFLLHGWQGEMFSQQLIASANNPDLTVITIDIQGNWMTPPVQIEAIDKITASLSQVDAGNGSAYQKSAAEIKDMVEAKGADVEERLVKANLSRVNVICAEEQAGFVQWAGFNIIATYGRPDSLTPQVVKELVDKGREGKVTLIIDNMQSGQDAGAGIAEELGSARVILSNFPGSYENTETWEKAIDYDVELLLAAITQ